jgi:ABC-type bacteriocin/lantibiotic exporter with double-glycine peptidase domain
VQPPFVVTHSGFHQQTRNPILHLHHLAHQQVSIAQGSVSVPNRGGCHVAFRQEVAAQAVGDLAGIDEDIKAMPMGLHTYVSDGSGGTSGGQRQRLMIARAIVARPRILMFDEATGALDNRTQGIVSRSLESLQATRGVIAHRLTTIMKADCIFVLNKGQIIQSGTYEQLIEQEGLFRDSEQYCTLAGC